LKHSIKIFKSATTKSILDVRSGLNYYKMNKSNEEVYKGNIIFTINEYGHSGEQAQAFIPKETAKMVLDTIKQHYFPRIYPNGFVNYGGTPSTKRARVFSLRYDSEKHRYVFQIDEGIGQVTKNGAVKMTKKEKTVMSFVSYEDTLKLAHEVSDFILQAEIVAMLNGKPLYTIMPSLRTIKEKQGQGIM